MEVLRRLKLPLGGAMNVSQPPPTTTKAKERGILPRQTPPIDDEEGDEQDEKRGDKTKDDSQQLLIAPKKARGKQPIAPKPDENADLVGRRAISSRKEASASAAQLSSPSRTQPRGASKGRINQKRQGRGRGNISSKSIGGGGNQGQDPSGSLRRKSSVVASHANAGKGGVAIAFPHSPQLTKSTSRNQQRKATSSKVGERKTKQESGLERQTSELLDSALTIPQASTPSASFGPTSRTVENHSKGRGVGPAAAGIAATRRPTPASYLLHSPSGVDARRRVVPSVSLFGEGGALIGELEVIDSNDGVGMNLEAPHARNLSTTYSGSLNEGPDLPVHRSSDFGASLGAGGYAAISKSPNFSKSSIASGADEVVLGNDDEDNNSDDDDDDDNNNNNDDEASLPDQPQALEVPKTPATMGRVAPNPENSTTSLGRQSTTSAALRRRGRSHSRTRHHLNGGSHRSDLDLAGVAPSVSTVPTSGSPSSPTQPRRSRSRRRRRSRSRSNSRTRSSSAEPASPSSRGSGPSASIGRPLPAHATVILDS